MIVNKDRNVSQIYVRPSGNIKKVRSIVTKDDTKSHITYFDPSPTIKNIDNYDPSKSYLNGIEYNLFTGDIVGFKTIQYQPSSTSTVQYFQKSCWGYYVVVDCNYRVGPGDLTTVPRTIASIVYASNDDVSSTILSVVITEEHRVAGQLLFIDKLAIVIDGETVTTISYDHAYVTDNKLYMYIYMNHPTDDYMYIKILRYYNTGDYQYMFDTVTTPYRISLNTYPKLRKLFNNADVNWIDVSSEPTTPYIELLGKTYPNVNISWQYRPRATHTIKVSVKVTQGYGTYSFTPEGSDIQDVSAKTVTIDATATASYNSASNKIIVSVSSLGTSVLVIVTYISISS